MGDTIDLKTRKDFKVIEKEKEEEEATYRNQYTEEAMSLVDYLTDCIESGKTTGIYVGIVGEDCIFPSQVTCLGYDDMLKLNFLSQKMSEEISENLAYGFGLISYEEDL